jgi:hypothetical protein
MHGSREESPVSAASPDDRKYHARASEGDERERCWRIACVDHPDFDESPMRTDRVIPVVVLEPR